MAIERTSRQKMAESGRTTVLEVMQREFIQSTGSNGTYVFNSITPPLAGGPDVEDITLHLMVEDRTANLKLKLRLRRSYDERAWETGEDMLESLAVDGNKYIISSPYSTRTNLGRYFQIEMGTDDTGSVESARVSVSVAIMTWAR